MPPHPRDRGATSVVLLVAVIPIIMVVFTLCVDAGTVTYAWIRADRAAQAGARAATVDLPPETAARASLSQSLRRSSQVLTTETDVTVSVTPVLLFGLTHAAVPRVSAKASIETEGTS